MHTRIILKRRSQGLPRGKLFAVKQRHRRRGTMGCICAHGSLHQSFKHVLSLGATTDSIHSELHWVRNHRCWNRIVSSLLGDVPLSWYLHV